MTDMKKEGKIYVCRNCGWFYDPAQGDPENGIKPGTPFEELPADWVCPICNVKKTCFDDKEWHGFKEYDSTVMGGNSGMMGQ